MPITVGDKLGSYEILAPIGAGGMGEVYRARDTKLKRDVALKVLPEAFARDPDRMARFQREAEVLASLNHPNIAGIYGVEDRALVMELVEGEWPKGPLPFDEAWHIASQIATALEYAHDKGVIHRDLKPSNVKVTPEGLVKLLDFGLAKAFTKQRESPVSTNENSPTLTLGATDVGVILGTAAYMSPEQARGKQVDKRADIWSFGAVLYELLTGERLFTGDDAAETLAAVIHKQPDFARAPLKVQRLLLACLEKDPRQRLRDIGDAKRLVASEAPASAARQVEDRRWKIAAGMVTLTLVGLAFVHFRERTPQLQRLEYTLAPPLKSKIDSFALSRDGRYLAMAGAQLWVRALDSLQSQALAGTEAATYPFWSPDSHYIGFFAHGKLNKIAVTGGPAQTLCDAPLGRGGTWNNEGVIVFASSNSGGLSRVLAAGGAPEVATKAPVGGGHRFPVFLPDGSRFLYRAVGAEENGIYLASLDGKENRRVLLDSVNPQFLPPVAGAKSGHLLFVRERTLMAQPVNPRTLEADGDVFPVAEHVLRGPYHDSFAISGNGVMIYQGGDAEIPALQYAWFDRVGKEVGKVGGRVRSRWFALSPDGKRAIIERMANAQGSSSDLWITDLEHGTESRLTFDASVNENPVWSPNGDRVLFTSYRRGIYNLYEKPSNGRGQDEIVLSSQENNFAVDWSRDGKFVIFQASNPNAKIGLWALPATGHKKPIMLQGQGNMLTGRLSPDVRWLAYVSDESGRNELYVIPFAPEDAAGKRVGGKWQISTTGGGQPQWRGDGKELFYITLDRKLMSMELNDGCESFEWTPPQTLFELPINLATTGQFAYRYAPAPDGKRFLVSTEPDASTEAPQLTIVVNWLAGLKK
jgi:serine/threonine protein kinase